MSRMKRWWMVACVVVLAAGLGVLGCGQKPAEPEKTAPEKGPGETKPVTTGPFSGPEVKPPVKPIATAQEPWKPEKPWKPGFPEITPVRTCAKAPVIDGDLSDACWKPAELPGEWVDVYTGKAAKPQPKVYVCYDDKNVYIAFLNPETDVKKIVAETTEHDGNVWTDDSNEIFIDPTAGKKDYLQFIVNAKGVLYDGKGKDGGWESKAQVKVKVMADGWSLEAAIPLADLGVEGSPKGQTWTANFCRNRQVTGEAEALARCDTGESFHNPDAFGKLKME